MLKLVNKGDSQNSVIPVNEKERQARLDEYDILDTLPEGEFDSLVELAALITGSPVSLINLLDHNRQWSKAAYGAKKESTSRNETVCQYTILRNENFEVQDLTKDDRFKNMTFVKDAPNYRSYSGYPLTTPDGYNIGALCVLDYKPKKLTKDQRKALQTLANEIIARLELRKQQSELEKLNREKDHFLRAVNHDIKSPINGIVGAANYLLNNWDGDREELSQFLKMIELSGRKLINYTGELVSNSLQHGESKLILDDVDLQETISDLIHIYTPLAEAKKVEIKSNLDTSRSFRIDNEKFKLIVSNLISNALKFSSNGDTIEVSTEFKGPDQNTLYCKVSDTGIGIPEKFLPGIFEKNKSHQRQGTQGEISTGMGLPIVKSYVELHHGTIKVESKEGEGTIFHIEIPEN
ncbi:MAG: GAF domain-containing sensor histidine kinase [Gracilimonas sp.]